MRTLEQVEAEIKKLNAEWSKLETKRMNLSDAVAKLSEEATKIKLTNLKKSIKPKFKKGDILYRNGKYYSAYIRGRVRLTSEGTIDLQGKYSYAIEYVKKDGSRSKRQESTGAWEYQLSTEEEK